MRTALFLVAMGLWVSGIQAQSIWFDEGWSAFAATRPTLSAAADADPTNPPLYYMLLHVMARVSGDSAFSLRFFSLLLGLLALALVYRLTAALFDRRAALWALALAVLLPPLWWAAQEARMYTLLALLVLVLALAWHRLVESPRRWAWGLLVAAELAVLYSHNTGPVIALWLNVMTLAVWLARRSLRQPHAPRWIISQMIVGLLWLPYFASRFVLLQEANSAIISRAPLTLDYVGRVWQGLWLSPWSIVAHEPLAPLLGTGLLVVWVALVDWKRARWLAGHGLVLTGGLVLGLSILGNELHGRYLVMVAPLLVVPLGAGLARLRSGLLRVGVLAGFALVLVVCMVLSRDPLHQHDDARSMARHYADTLSTDDTVLAWSYADRYDLWYYWEWEGVTARRVTLPEGADLDSIGPLLPTSGDVALNVWYTQRADYRGMMNCLLSQSTQPVEFAVNGMTSLLYRAPALSVPPLHPVDFVVLDAGVELARIEAAGQARETTADDGICLPLQLRLMHPVAGDLKAALIVRNALGWEVGRADAIFATANQRTTSAIQSGETAAAYPLLRLPPGAPPGDYSLHLQIYDEQGRLEGYDLLNGVRRSVPLAEWPVVPGAVWGDFSRSRYLLEHDAQDGVVQTGARLRWTGLWDGTGDLPALVLDGRWLIAPQGAAADGLLLDWREIVIPLDALAGEAELRLEDGTLLARYMVEALPMLTEAPAYQQAVDVPVGDVARLVGYTIDSEPVYADAPLRVTLIWQAGTAPVDARYTVFVQLLDADGVLIAQSDAEPAQGSRPTTGWRAGEYVVDGHQLVFNEQAHAGPATLIAGLYDSVTGVRLATGSGDYVPLPGTVMVR